MVSSIASVEIEWVSKEIILSVDLHISQVHHPREYMRIPISQTNGCFLVHECAELIKGTNQS